VSGGEAAEGQGEPIPELTIPGPGNIR